jgi:hypothetical protein
MPSAAPLNFSRRSRWFPIETIYKPLLAKTQGYCLEPRRKILAAIDFYSKSDQTEAWLEALRHSLAPADICLHPLEPDMGTVAGNGRHPSPGRKNVPPIALLCLSEMTDPTLIEYCREAARRPVIFAGPIGPAFQIGPAVVPGQTACLACLERQADFFPGIVPAPASVSPAGQLLADLAGRLAAEVSAFAGSAGSSLLRRGYLLRTAPTAGAWQVVRGLRDPFCEICSIYARYPSEAIYIK